MLNSIAHIHTKTENTTNERAHKQRHVKEKKGNDNYLVDSFNRELTILYEAWPLIKVTWMVVYL